VKSSWTVSWRWSVTVRDSLTWPFAKRATTVQSPVPRRSSRYLPAASETVVRTAPLFAERAWITASSTGSLSSVRTVPVSEADVVWAWALPGGRATATSMAAIHKIRVALMAPYRPK
jgi:hypothetical protein